MCCNLLSIFPQKEGNAHFNFHNITNLYDKHMAVIDMGKVLAGLKIMISNVIHDSVDVIRMTVARLRLISLDKSSGRADCLVTLMQD